MADKPRALPFWLRVNIKKLVEKGAPGLHKCFFESNWETVLLWAKRG